MRKFILQLAVLALLLLPVAVLAAPLVSVRVTAEKEVTVGTKGEKTNKKVAATAIQSGDVIFYTMSYINSGDEAATNAVLDDPTPQGTAYLPGSAFGSGANATFSIDGGKTYKKPSLLTHEIKLPDGTFQKRVASPGEYTHIRWVIDKIPAGEKGTVGFQVLVK